MKKIGSRFLTGFGSLVVGPLAIFVLVEWAAWALWLLPPIVFLAVYFWLKPAFSSLVFNTLAGIVGVLTVLWAHSLGIVSHHLPSLQRFLGIPFIPEPSGATDALPFAVGIVGVGGIALLAMSLGTWTGIYASGSPKVRRGLMCVVSLATSAAGATMLYILQHPVAPYGTALIGIIMAAVIASQDPEFMRAEVEASKARALRERTNRPEA